MITRRLEQLAGIAAKAWTWAGLAAAFMLGMLAWSGCGDDEVTVAPFVSPIYTGSCELIDCGEHGTCQERKGGAPYCECEAGHFGDECELCGDGYHLDALDQCIPDRFCNEEAVDPCLPYGTCDDSDGALRCLCAEGYAGARCELCASGYAHGVEGDCLKAITNGGGPTRGPLTGCSESACGGHGECSEVDDEPACACYPAYTGERCELCAPTFIHDGTRCVPMHATPTGRCLTRESFGSEADFPTNPNTCVSRSALAMDGLELSSLAGVGTVWLCAAVEKYGLLSEHIFLEAGTTSPAQLFFDPPIEHLVFEYGARSYGAGPTLSLELAADGDVIDTLQAMRGEHGVLEYAFDAPIERFTLRSLNPTTEEIALDEIEFRRSDCKQEGSEP